MQALPLEQKVAMVLPFLRAGRLVGVPLRPACARPVRQIVSRRPATGSRWPATSSIIRDFFVADDQLAYDEKAFDKQRPQAGCGRRCWRASASAWPRPSRSTRPTLEKLHCRRYRRTKGSSSGEIIHAVRVAVTGKSVGLGLVRERWRSWARAAWRIDRPGSCEALRLPAERVLGCQIDRTCEPPDGSSATCRSNDQP